MAISRLYIAVSSTVELLHLKRFLELMHQLHRKGY